MIFSEPSLKSADTKKESLNIYKYEYITIHTIVVLPETARGPSTSALSGSKINTLHVPN